MALAEVHGVKETLEEDIPEVVFPPTYSIFSSKPFATKAIFNKSDQKSKFLLLGQSRVHLGNPLRK